MKTVCKKQIWLWLTIAVVLSASLTLALTGCQPAVKSESAAVAFTTPYQAVLLSNNSVYFGKLAGYGTSNPVLTDVYYIVSKTDPTTKEVQNILVKRGKELHGPDRMYLNPNSIVFVEPVGTDSKVAQLISEANQQK
jgi:small nuclear ribonucleoprotein (snRNP)-like protein